MKRVHVVQLSMLMVLVCSLFSPAQQSVAVATDAIVPPLVNFSGVLTDVNGKPLTGVVGVTFFLYKDQQGGSPLWLETQNAKPNSTGHYTVMLGSTTSQGIPANIFASGEARWLGVQVQGQAEQARVLLVSAPYALKAGDAETLGGKPASAFMAASGNAASSNGPGSAVTGTGKKDFVPLWLSTTKLGSSNLFQSTAGDLGIGTTTPAANLDVNGSSDIRNTLTLFPNGSAPTLSINGTAFNVSNIGLVSFVSGQTFPGTGAVTSVGTGLGLKGGPITTSGTLTIDPTVVPQLSANNTFSGTQTINNTETITVNNGHAALWATQTGSGNAIWSSASNAGSFGVVGVNIATTGTGGGVDGVGSSATGYGVVGASPNVGVSGTSAGSSQRGAGAGRAGLWGDTGGVNGGGYWGVLGTADQNSAGGFLNKGDFPTVYARNSGSGVGVYGAASSASKTGSGSMQTGVWGDTGGGPGFAAIAGTSDESIAGYFVNNSPDFKFEAVQVLSKNSGAFALTAIATKNSTEGVDHQSPSALWADTGDSPGTSQAVLATADDNWAARLLNNSSSHPALGAQNDAAAGALVFHTIGGTVGGSCSIDVSGNLNCSGKIGADAPVDGGARKVSLYGVQSAENWFEDAGSGQLRNGSAQIALDPTFAQTVNTAVEYHVFLTPNGDCKGLYVRHKTATSFEVRELGGGSSSIAFDYRIMAKRRGFEDVRLADVTEKYRQFEAERALQQQNRKTLPPPQRFVRPLASAKPVSLPTTSVTSGAVRSLVAKRK